MKYFGIVHSLDFLFTDRGAVFELYMIYVFYWNMFQNVVDNKLKTNFCVLSVYPYCQKVSKKGIHIVKFFRKRQQTASEQ